MNYSCLATDYDGTIAQHGDVCASTYEALKELRFDLQVILNKGAVMVLPGNVDKATGLRAALTELRLAASDVAGTGDAENDHVFLQICGYSVAVGNAIPELKAQVDLVTT